MAEIKELIPAIPMEYWKYDKGGQRHLTGHMYRNSLYECDDNCGTCDGARCDYCREIIEGPKIYLSIPADVCDWLENRFGEFKFPDMHDLQRYSKDYYKAVVAYLGCEDPLAHLEPEKKDTNDKAAASRSELKERRKAAQKNILIVGFKSPDSVLERTTLSDIRGGDNIGIQLFLYIEEYGKGKLPTFIPFKLTEDKNLVFAADHVDRICSGYEQYYKAGYYEIPTTAVVAAKLIYELGSGVYKYRS